MCGGGRSFSRQKVLRQVKEEGKLFFQTQEFSLGVHDSVLHKSLKRPYSMCSMCKILLASVDDLFHPDGPIEFKPQSVKSSYS